jgi:hypothetical protein
MGLSGAFGVVPNALSFVSGSGQLEDVLKEGAWVHETRLSERNVVESWTLTFCDRGRVGERISDDTGMYDSYGTWTLEHTHDGDILTLSGEHLHYRGHFPITYSEKAKAFHLRWTGETTMRFRAVKANDGAPCVASKSRYADTFERAAGRATEQIVGPERRDVFRIKRRAAKIA